MMLYRKNDAPLDFDFAKVTEQTQDNPVFYVQYAHARASSVLRNVRETYPDLNLEEGALAVSDLDRLTDEAEINLIRRIAQFPRMVEAAAAATSRIASVSISMILLATFTGCGTEAKTCHNYDLFTRVTES